MTLLQALDLLGTLVFAFSGSLLAARRGLDVFGFVALALAAGTAGGVLRDVLLGALPPAALADWRYATVCVGAGLVVFVFAAQATSVERLIRVVDAFGLGLFAAAGTTKALDANVGATAALFLGVLTAIGGGVARDLLAGIVPVVLRAEIYALAAALGALVIVVLAAAGTSLSIAAPIGAVVATSLRLAAMRFSWQAPRRAPIDE